MTNDIDTRYRYLDNRQQVGKYSNIRRKKRKKKQNIKIELNLSSVLLVFFYRRSASVLYNICVLFTRDFNSLVTYES